MEHDGNRKGGAMFGHCDSLTYRMALCLCLSGEKSPDVVELRNDPGCLFLLSTRKRKVRGSNNNEFVLHRGLGPLN